MFNLLAAVPVDASVGVVLMLIIDTLFNSILYGKLTGGGESLFLPKACSGQGLGFWNDGIADPEPDTYVHPFGFSF